MRNKNLKNPNRLNDAVSYRVSAAQRDFLERIADKYNVGLGAAARIVLDEIMKAGVET
jgi:hypothetical protein